MSTHLTARERLRPAHLEWIAAAGFTTIELWAAEHHFDFFSDRALDELRDSLARFGLQTGSIHFPFYHGYGGDDFRHIGFTDPSPAGREMTRRNVERLPAVATALDCRLFIVHPVSTAARDGGNRRRLAAALEWFLPVCHDRGIKVALENIMLPETRALVLTEYARSHPEGVGICLDLGHAHIDGGLVHEIFHAAPYLITLHAHDNFGVRDQHLPPGRGNIDWPLAMSILRREAPRLRYFTFELDGPADGAAREADCRRLLDEAMTFWQNMSGETR